VARQHADVAVEALGSDEWRVGRACSSFRCRAFQVLRKSTVAAHVEDTYGAVAVDYHVIRALFSTPALVLAARGR
jgi:hypothetical protein